MRPRRRHDRLTIGLVLLADAEGVDEAPDEQSEAESVDEHDRLALQPTKASVSSVAMCVSPSPRLRC